MLVFHLPYIEGLDNPLIEFTHNVVSNIGGLAQ